MFFTGWTLLREPSLGYLSNCDEANVCGPKSFIQHVLGIFTQFSKPCLWLVESKESSPVDEEEIKMDEGVDTSLTY